MSYTPWYKRRSPLTHYPFPPTRLYVTTSNSACTRGRSGASNASSSSSAILTTPSGAWLSPAPPPSSFFPFSPDSITASTPVHPSTRPPRPPSFPPNNTRSEYQRKFKKSHNAAITREDFDKKHFAEWAPRYACASLSFSPPSLSLACAMHACVYEGSGESNDPCLRAPILVDRSALLDQQHPAFLPFPPYPDSQVRDDAERLPRGGAPREEEGHVHPQVRNG